MEFKKNVFSLGTFQQDVWSIKLYLSKVREAFYFNFIVSDGIPSCIYCFVSKYKYDKLSGVCGHTGVFGNNFNLGHTPERGQRPHIVISASSYPFGKSWYLPEEIFFFCFILPFSAQWGVSLYPQPNLNLHNFSRQYHIENANSRILFLTSGYALKSLRELFLFFLFLFLRPISKPQPEIKIEFVWGAAPVTGALMWVPSSTFSEWSWKTVKLSMSRREDTQETGVEVSLFF